MIFKIPATHVTRELHFCFARNVRGYLTAYVMLADATAPCMAYGFIEFGPAVFGGGRVDHRE